MVALTNNKIKVGIATAIATLATIIFLWYKPVGNKGLYDNKASTFMIDSASIDKEVAWVKKNGFNSYCSYGMSDYISSKPSLVRYLNRQLRRAGISDIGFIYSSPDFISKLEKFQNSCASDSMKFSFINSEYEQYQKGKSRPFFYSMIRITSTWAHKNGIKSYVYQGHPDLTDVDTIVHYADRVYQHAYREYDKYGSKVGDDVFGYVDSKLEAYGASYHKQFPNSKDRFSIMLIYSTEGNPAPPAETKFGYKYFLTHDWGDAHKAYQKYLSLRTGIPNIKNYTLDAGYQIFVGSQAKKIKP
jgi:hypothetical protein